MRRAFLGGAVIALGILVAGCSHEASPPEPEHSPSTSAVVPTTPAPTPTLSPAAAAVARMTTEQRAASVVMGHIPSTDPATLHDYMASGIGGFILMGANVGDTPAEVRAVTSALRQNGAPPPLIAIDQEGGDVSRLPWDDGPAGRQLQRQDPAATRTAFTERARLVAETGANVNFGIIADIAWDPSSFIAPRALGTDPQSASDRVAQAVAGEKGTVLSTLKHFPGHGAAAGDSHQSIPSTSKSLEQWRAEDAQPFRAGIDAGAELLMFGHLAYTSVDAAPASLSPRWHEIARNEMGFQGVMITDDLGMLLSSGVKAYGDQGENAAAAIAAGNDMVLLIAGSTPRTASEAANGIVAAVKDGRITEDRLRDAAERVMTLRLKLA